MARGRNCGHANWPVRGAASPSGFDGGCKRLRGVPSGRFAKPCRACDGGLHVESTLLTVGRHSCRSCPGPPSHHPQVSREKLKTNPYELYHDWRELSCSAEGGHTASGAPCKPTSGPPDLKTRTSTFQACRIASCPKRPWVGPILGVFSFIWRAMPWCRPRRLVLASSSTATRLTSSLASPHGSPQS